MIFGRRRIAAITPREASERLAAGELVVVDVRTAREVAQVRVPGSINVPLHEVRGRLDEIPAGRPVAFLCRSGHRSTVAARRAAGGRPDVLNITGGMHAWVAAGLPADSGRG